MNAQPDDIEDYLDDVPPGDAPADPLAGIRAAIRADLEAGPAAVDAAVPPRWVSRPVLPVAGANLAAPGSTGKTTIALGEKVRVTCGGELYGHPVEMQGSCVLVTAEDGAAHARYLLQQILQDGVESGQLPERAAIRAKSDIRIIGWHRATYGAIVEVDQFGGMRRAPVYDLLLEMIAAVSPVYVTLDPAVLFGPGERYGNDGDAYLAAMLHESAIAIGACVQLLDHVAQTVARAGIIDQYAARGGTAKTDNARLARQLVRVTPAMAEGILIPQTVTDEEIAAGRLLQLHTTKSNYAQLPAPAWLRRRRYWIEYLRAPSAEEAVERETEHQAEQDATDAAAVVDYLRQQLATGKGIRLTTSELANEGGPTVNGKRLKRDPIRKAVRVALADGRLKQLDLPKDERQGSRQTYLAPSDYVPPAQETAS